MAAAEQKIDEEKIRKTPFLKSFDTSFDKCNFLSCQYTLNIAKPAQKFNCFDQSHNLQPALKRGMASVCFDFSPLCVFKCFLKLHQQKSSCAACSEEGAGICLFWFFPLCVFKLHQSKSFAACSEEGAGICSTLLVVFSCILIVVAFMFLYLYLYLYLYLLL